MDYAAEIDDVSHHNAYNIYGVINSLASDVTSFSLFKGTEWPHFSIPHFDYRVEEAKGIAGADFIAFSPVVVGETKSSWEAYSVSNQEWIQDGLQYTGVSSHEAPSIPPNVYDSRRDNVYEQGEETSYYLPLWQTSPAPLDTSIINYDMHSHPTYKQLSDFIVEENKPALSEVVNVRTLFGSAIPYRDGHPQSLLVQPILQELNESSSVVGMITLVIPWDIYFTNLLHQGANGIIIVLRNSCDDVFTYQIDGPEAQFLGEGDWHDPRFDDFVFIHHP